MLHIRQEIITRGFATMNKRALNKVFKEMWRKVALYWHAKILPRHFAPGAAAEYGYPERTTKYNRRKRTQVGHTTPLVHSGRLKRSVLGMARVSSTSKGCRVQLKTPVHPKTGARYIWFHHMAEQLTKVSRRDRRELTRYARAVLAEELERARRSAPTRRERVG